MLRDALEFARAGDTIVVWKLDRLARSMNQLIETLETLRVRNIGFRSLTEALDTTTPQGRLVFHLFGALAEFERGLIRERTQAGLAAARRLGRTGGRPAKLTDDDLDVATTLLANPDITVAEVAERVGGLCCKPCNEVQERDCRSWRRGHAASSSIRSVTNCIVSARTQGPIPKARSTMRASPRMSRVRLKIAACPLRSARITSKPLIVA
jgi:resolvase-like protein